MPLLPLCSAPPQHHMLPHRHRCRCSASTPRFTPPYPHRVTDRRWGDGRRRWEYALLINLGFHLLQGVEAVELNFKNRSSLLEVVSDNNISASTIIVDLDKFFSSVAELYLVLDMSSFLIHYFSTELYNGVELNSCFLGSVYSINAKVSKAPVKQKIGSNIYVYIK